MSAVTSPRRAHAPCDDTWAVGPLQCVRQLHKLGTLEEAMLSWGLEAAATMPFAPPRVSPQDLHRCPPPGATIWWLEDWAPRLVG